MGMLERGGKVRASVIPDRTKVSMQPIVRGSVEPGTQSVTCPTCGSTHVKFQPQHRPGS
jgi:hypothetical protein